MRKIGRKIGVAVLVLFVVGIGSPSYAGGIQGKVKVTGAKNLENIIVYVENAQGSFKPSKKRPQMNHLNLQFVPSRLAVLKGTIVDFPNSDPVFHSGFSISDSNPFDLGIYGRGHEKFVHFKNPGVVDIFCHIHSHMHAFVYVLESPFFASTAKDGMFSIPDVPPGEYQVKAWMSPSVRQSKTVSVKKGKTASLNFSLSKKFSLTKN